MLTSFEQALLRYIRPEQLHRIQRVTVGIAGTGGLGSNGAASLVRCGFRRFVLVDFDRVDLSNLNRQFFFSHQVGSHKVAALAENLLSINPDLDLDLRVLKLDEGNVRQCFDICDVVVEALDDVEGKALLARHYMGGDRLFVAASGIGGFGNTDAVRTRRIREGFFLVGDGVSGVSEACPPLAPSVTIAAAKQADVVLTHFMMAPKPLADGKGDD